MENIVRQWRNIFCTLAVLALLFPAFAAASQSVPVAITREVTFVTEKSAKLGGRVNASEMPDARQWFEWGLSGQSGIVYETQHNSTYGSQLVDTSADIIGLAPNTQYFYRQIAENGRGRVAGQTVYFTTKPLPLHINPIVIAQTIDATSITESGATVKGYLSPHGNSTMRWWFEWGETNAFENETYHNGFGADSGMVTMALTSLSAGTVHYYRLVAENADGRVYGNTRVFVTLGTALQKSEAPRAQSIPTPQAGGDGVTRTTTTNGGVASAGAGSAPGTRLTTGGSLPGDIFGAFFGRKLNAGGVGTGVASGGATTAEPQATVTPVSTQANANPQSQVAGTAASRPFGAFWGSLTGKKDVELVIEKVGPTKISVHTPVEYKIRYSYFLSEPAVSAKLKIILPSQVIYVGDNTNNELLIEESSGAERVYVLPLGRLEKGSTRTVSILGITTGDAKVFPDARARIEYATASGEVQIVSSESGAVGTTKASASGAKNIAASGSAPGILPSSVFGWLFYIAFVAGFIFILRKVKAYYDKRKEEIALEEEESARRAQENGENVGQRAV